MGASESTGQSNGKESGGDFCEAAATAVAIAAVAIAAGVAFVNWVASTLFSDNTDSEEKDDAMAINAVGDAVAAWGVSRLLSDNTDSKEKDDAMAIKAPNPSIRGRETQPRIRFLPSPPDRFRINTDGGYHSTKGESSGYGGIIQDYGVYTGSEVAKQLVNKESKVDKVKSIWHPPPRGLYKMNTDGACKPNPEGPGGYGGILRDGDGEFVCCFYGFIDWTSDGLTAEFRGILRGLRLLDTPRYKRSILETDCQAAFEWVTKRKDGSSKSDIISDCWDIITECIELIDKNEIDVQLIPGKHANRCADKLAAMALILQEEYFEIKELPRRIKHLVDKEKESKAHKVKSIWYPPPRGRYKMNTDGACKPNPGGPGGYGGILRDDDGEFVCCFYGFIDRRSDGLTAEFHGILQGLRLLNTPRYKGSILETYCQAAFKWVTKRKVGSSKSDIISDCRDIITECRELINKNEIIVQLIPGKHANRCAYKLAAMALKKEDQVYLKFEDVPRDIKSFIDEDKRRMGCWYFLGGS